MMDIEVFETERLFLRPTIEEDAEFFLELQNSSTWLQYIGDRNVNTVEDAADFIKHKIFPQYIELGYSNFTVFLKSNSAPIGSCGLYAGRNGIEGVDLGFAFLPEYHNKGYAYEAAKKVMQIAYQDFGLKKLYAITSEINTPSQRLIKKLGLEFIERKCLPDEDDESLIYIGELKTLI
ncbi:GNAT family N-acetyltransferase [Aureibacter tunicatorum]|uniref:RimJ/RimL family protein N-acetyltransferase n=1 Tax=Aureibacter tunicatorum TaxID=866807 RepID=A0AAE4BS39_9BACT|nr:GNAT family N-acetyltransferase [Aureibacter tunicatorum]MDR6240819.1 RimJ/RimL family protein N-acetyltransferase [Aureibacter tunicatorum]BDD06848.1 alanine acetyltransferase [Aureibacter tunicatorum]